MNTIETVYEKARGCGYRKPGGLYFRTDGISQPCGKLPIVLDVCPTCHHGVHPARGWTWIDIQALVGDKKCTRGDSLCSMFCPLADLSRVKGCGLLWVGEKFYPTPDAFAKEAHEMGVSRRISRIPNKFVLGETWIAFAHRAVSIGGEKKPAIFHMCKPSRIEYVVKEGDSEEKIAGLVKRGITPVIVKRHEEKPELEVV